MATRLKRYLKSFTLIELIIVIAIIAVLGATAFLLLTQWMSKGRDAQRISDLRVIENALSIQITKEDGLPLPDGYSIVKTGTNIVIYQGKFGSGVISKMNSLTKVPLDRQYGEYEYSLLGDKVTYKVKAIVENEQNKSAFINRVLADNLFYRYAGKDVKGIIVGDDFIYLPNMFLTGYINGEQELGSAVNNFLGNKVGEYVTGGIVNKDNKDGIIAMMTGFGLSVSEATSILSKATGVSTSIAGTTEPAQPEVNSWCYYSTNHLSNAHVDWNNTDLKYDSVSNKCYVFGDEDDNAKAACNKWLTDNATLGGEWVWVPSRWFVSDGYGIGMKDSFYQRYVNYNGKDYVCRGFAVMKYEAKFTDNNLKIKPSALWNTWAVQDYANDDDEYELSVSNGGIISKAQDYPIAYIRQGEAIKACGTDGTYHLITNNEWMSLARNIEHLGDNWTSGTVGQGNLYRGNVNLNDSSSWSSFIQFGTYVYPSGNDGELRGNGLIGNGLHILSNGKKVWDVSGSLGEHVNKSNLPNTTNLRNNGTWNSTTIRVSNVCGGTGWHSYYNNDGFNQCNFTNDYSYENIGPANINLNSLNGIGRITSQNSTNNVFLRGGGGAAEANAGIYNLNTHRTHSNRDFNIGFRCAR